MQIRHRWYATAGVVAVVCAGVGAPATAPVLDMPEITLTAGAEQITLDLVRSAQDARPEPIVTATIPGPPLTETGRDQAQDLADTLAQQGPYAGIYAGQQIRMAETAAPLADALGTQVHTLPGLDAMDAGSYEGVPIASPGGTLFALTSAAWILGLEFVPIPDSSDPNGVAFEDRFDDAVHTIYANTVGGSGPSTDVAVSADQAITVWTMMNVDNPDFATLVPLFLEAARSGSLESVLPETGEIVVRGDPTDGWTLVSWNGHPIPADPGLGTALFVDVRDLITAPQTAAWHVWEAVLGGDPATIQDALEAGIHNVVTEIVGFPGAVFDDLADAFTSGI